MKKMLVVIMAMIMALSMVACGGADTGKEDTDAVKVIEINLTEELYAFGVDKNQPELLNQVNAFIKKIMDDGTFDSICDKYFGDGEPTAVKSAALDPSKDQLVVATNAAFEPFEYMIGDSYYGIDMEIAQLLANELGQELVIMNMDFDAVCLSVGQHQCDIAMAGLTVNEERKEYVTFSDSYYEASQVMIVKGDDTTFDACTDAASVEAILNNLTKDNKIGVQSGTTGQFYTEGDADWGFAGLPATCVPYKNGSLAVQDLINGNIDYVIIDVAPAACIVEAINEMQ
ncbi:MAG: transporter substrate-binding domain-containing protein [Lachnospiraceae bacterium]|nr:transporter substrate-binding domain-containing protein [Lachnospiraceae bacterium]